MNSLSVCRISWSRAFTRCWQLLRESLSLSSSPFILALFTICTRMGVSSPSRASKPYKITGGRDRRLTNKHVEGCMMDGGTCQPWRRLPLSSEPCLRQRHISSGHACRCCAAVVNHSLESQHSLLQQSFQVFDCTKTDCEFWGMLHCENLLLTLSSGVHAAEGSSQFLCLHPASRGQLPPPLQHQQQRRTLLTCVWKQSTWVQLCWTCSNVWKRGLIFSYLPPHLRFWAAHGAGMWAALSCWSQRSGHTFIRKMKLKN